jgi:aminoglycoside phosphotransferase (APT) family kinase protein
VTPRGLLGQAPRRFASRSPTQILSIARDDGTTLSLFVKRLEPEEHPDKRRRDREPLVYRHLLAARDLPVPRFHESGWDPQSGTYELVLEHVDDWSLKYHDLEHWMTAARRLAELHAHFAARPAELERADFLLRLDREYFEAWAARAITAAGAVSPDLARHAERALGGHGEIVAAVLAAPPTLVHNDLAPKNVIAQTASRPARICIVDWEMAGVGCGLLDLAHLAHGLAPRDARRLRDAYASALGHTGGELRGLLAACEHLNAVYRLAHVGEWGIGAAEVARWVTDLAGAGPIS